jgi:predicted nucleotidyltransferase
MKELILKNLKEIERDNNIKILLAVESGSRAWGFASPDSDYDVRFVYVRHHDDYLRLDAIRDVIEFPVSDALDINGWDLQKTLRLLHKSNPTLFEWFSSAITYVETPFVNDFRKLMKNYFSTKRSLYHYISMAEGNYRGILKGKMVRAKKYFYVLRPVLACKWILEKMTPPPILFNELADAHLPTYLKKDVETLLELKINSPEIKEIPRITSINEFLDTSIANIKAQLSDMDEEDDYDWKPLNTLFLSVLSM